MQKSIKLIISWAILAAAFGGFAYAQTVTPTPSNVASTTITADNPSHLLAGSNAGNLPSFEVAFDVTSLPANAKIEAAVLSYTQTGVSSGLVKIIDKYSTSILDSKGLGSEGVISSDRLVTAVQSWTTLTHNLGLLLQGSELGSNDIIQFTKIAVTITYSIPDTTPPTIRTISVIQTTDSAAIIKVETDEPVVFEVKYGKTSVYNKEQDFKTDYVSSAELNLTNLQGGVGYHYQISVFDMAGNSATSRDATFTTIFQNGNVLGDSIENIDPSLGAPSNLAVELTRVDNKYTANIAWTPTDKEIDGYVIYRGYESIDNVKEYKRVGKVSNYIDAEVLEEHTYYYFVRAYKANSLSTKSDNVAVLVPKVPVENVITSLFNGSDTRAQLVMVLFAAAAIILSAYYLLFKGTKSILAKLGPKPKKTNVLKDPDFYR